MLRSQFHKDHGSRPPELYIDEAHRLFVLTMQPRPAVGRPAAVITQDGSPSSKTPGRTYLGLMPFHMMDQEMIEELRPNAKPLDKKSHISVKVNLKEQRLEYMDDGTHTITYAAFQDLDQDVAHGLRALPSGAPLRQDKKLAP